MRRVKWGVGAAAVVGLAWFLSNFFNMGGLGTGEGTQVGLPVRTAAPTTADDPAELPPQDEPETVSVATEGEDRSIGEGGVVEALIDDREFFLRRGTGDDAEWIPAEPDAIAAYARQAPGDESGVRIRIRRKPSAKAGSEQELNEALLGAGLTDAEIDMPQDFVE